MPAGGQRIGLVAGFAFEGDEAAGGQVAPRELFGHHAHLQFADDDEAKEGFGQNQQDQQSQDYPNEGVRQRHGKF